MRGDRQNYTSPCSPVTHSLSHPVTQWSDAGHAQMGTFFGSRAPISRAKFKEKH